MIDAPEQEILRPDPRDRRRAIVLVSIATAVGASVIVGAQAYLAGLAEQAAIAPAHAVDRARTFVTYYGILLSFGLLAIAVWLRSTACQAFAEERFPPSTTRVLRPTRIATDDAARDHAAKLLVCAVLLIVAAFVLPLSVLSMFDALAESMR